MNYASRRDRRKNGFLDFYFDDDNDGEVDYTRHYNREGESLFVSFFFSFSSTTILFEALLIMVYVIKFTPNKVLSV